MSKLTTVIVVGLISATFLVAGQIDASNSRPTQDSPLQTISLLSEGEMLTVWGGTDECGCKALTGACDGENSCDPLIPSSSVEVLYSFNPYQQCKDQENRVDACTPFGAILCVQVNTWDEPNCEGIIVGVEKTWKSHWCENYYHG